MQSIGNLLSSALHWDWNSSYAKKKWKHFISLWDTKYDNFPIVKFNAQNVDWRIAHISKVFEIISRTLLSITLFSLSIPSRKYQILVIYLNSRLSFWVTLILLVKIMY
jgi:hypothetical protein